MAELVHVMLQDSAARAGERQLVVEGDSARTYAEVDEAASRIAAVLRARGVRRGDRVALLAANSAFYVECYYGILKAGAVAVPLNSAADPRDLSYYIANCGAQVLIVDRKLQRPVHAAMSQGLSVKCLLTEGPSRLGASAEKAGIEVADLLAEADAQTPFVDPEVAQDDLASLIYTSGSTGRPRGVMLTHGNIVANTQSIVSYLELTADDSVLQLLPFYYVFGKSLLNTHVAVGGTIVIENRFMYPSTAVETLEQAGCTGLSGVPSTFQILLDQTDFARRELPALRYVSQAGGPMSPTLTRRLIDAVPAQRVFIMYGCTEASARLSYLPPEALRDHVGKIGKPIPGVELRVLRDDGSEAEEGEVGELVARGPNIMRGYWGDPESTAAVMRDDGYHTGDLAVRDASGYFTIVGRKKDMIKSGGHRISPQEIEDVLCEHPGVAEAAVIGLPDELLGESILAVVVPREAVSDEKAFEGELKSTAGARLPRYKVPSRFVLRDALPKNPSGKVLKQALRQEWTSG